MTQDFTAIMPFMRLCGIAITSATAGEVKGTLPWREGHHLDFVAQISPDRAGTGLVPRAAGDDTWSVPVNTLDRHEIEELFSE